MIAEGSSELSSFCYEPKISLKQTCLKSKPNEKLTAKRSGLKSQREMDRFWAYLMSLKQGHPSSQKFKSKTGDQRVSRGRGPPPIHKVKCQRWGAGSGEPHLFSEFLHPFLKIIVLLLLFHLLLVDLKTFLYLIQSGAFHTHRHTQVSLIWWGEQWRQPWLYSLSPSKSLALVFSFFFPFFLF